MAIVDDIKSLQAEIANTLEQRKAAVKSYLDENVLDFSADTKQWLQRNALYNTGVSNFFEDTKKYKAPSGLLAIFFEQSRENKQKLADLLAVLKSKLLILSANVELSVTSDLDVKLAKANAKLSALAKQVEAERPKKKPVSKGATHGPATWRNVPPSARAPAPVASSLQSVTVIENNDNSSFLTAAIMLNAATDCKAHGVDNSDCTNADVIAPGGGGDFGGGGATGSWSPAPTDDLGASNFS